MIKGIQAPIPALHFQVPVYMLLLAYNLGSTHDVDSTTFTQSASGVQIRPVGIMCLWHCESLGWILTQAESTSRLQLAPREWDMRSSCFGLSNVIFNIIGQKDAEQTGGDVAVCPGHPSSPAKQHNLCRWMEAFHHYNKIPETINLERRKVDFDSQLQSFQSLTCWAVVGMCDGAESLTSQPGNRVEEEELGPRCLSWAGMLPVT